MSKLPTATGKQVIRALLREGFAVSRNRRARQMWCGCLSRNPDSGQQAAETAAPRCSVRLFVGMLSIAALLCMFAAARAENIAESADFAIDTRDYGGSVVAESGDFTVDTVTESGGGGAESVLFTVDTRAPSPDLSAAEGVLFTVDTRPYANAPPLVLAGRVKSVAGANIGGASVTLQLFGSPQEQVVTLNNGTYLTPPLPPRSYTLVVSAPSWQPQLRNLTNGWRGGAQSMDFLMLPNPVLTTQNSNGRLPTPAEAPECRLVPSGVLMLLSGPLNPNLPTVVPSHGWLANADGWPSVMGARIHAQAPAVNVVAWDWRIPANRRVPIPIVEAACQGPKLGAALQVALRPATVSRFISSATASALSSTAAPATICTAAVHRVFPKPRRPGIREKKPAEAGEASAKVM